MPTPDDLLRAARARDGARPLYTYYDDATGERVELSVATAANWVAKLANFLVDDCDVEPGATVGVQLPLHWQQAVVMLAAWVVGAAVSFEAGDVTFRHVPDGAATGDDVITLSLAPMGVDLSRLVASQPDDFVAVAASGEELVASLPTDLPDRARVLTVTPFDEAASLGYALLGPLAGDGSAVLVGSPEPDRLPQRCADERVTHTVGVDVPALPRLG